MIRPDDLGFWRVFHRYKKVARGLWSRWEIIIAILSGVFTVVVIEMAKQPLLVAHMVADVTLSASVQLLGIVVAGFAISTAVIDPKFGRFALRVGSLEGLLFPFWFNAILWGINVAVSTAVYLITEGGIVLNIWLINGIAFLNSFLFSLALLFLLSLMGILFTLTIYRGLYEEVATDAPELNKTGHTQRHPPSRLASRDP